MDLLYTLNTFFAMFYVLSRFDLLSKLSVIYGISFATLQY